jgi:dipeptidyl aminopeptidase/acylaminoacyl peptidase
MSIVAIVAACSVASSSVGPGASPAAGTPTNTTPPAAAPPATTSPAATAFGPLGGGLLLVYQLDGTDTDTAKTETVFTIDVGSGAKTVLGSIPVTDVTCCPTKVRFSADRTRAFLFSERFRGIVDLQAGTVEGVETRAPDYGVRVSTKGDRLAWVDEVTGTSETIVIADLAGKQIRRLSLPEGAWVSEAAWSPDDSVLAVTTSLPAGTGSAPQIRLASIIACCTIDRGPEVTHLLIVPVDGSPLRKVLDNSADVAKDQLVPIPSKPPTVVGDTPKVRRGLGGPSWSPDRRSIILTGSVCPPSWMSRYTTGPCTYTVYTVDVDTGVRTVVAEGEIPYADAVWSPDSRRIAYVAMARSGSGELYVMDRDGRNQTRLSDDEGGPVWSPDGKWIAFWRINRLVPEGQNRLELWVMPSDGGEARLIAQHAAAGW